MKPPGTSEGTWAPVTRGEVSPRRAVPSHIEKPDYAETGRPGPGARGNRGTRIERMRRACRAAAEVLDHVGGAVRPGETTDSLDALAHAACLARGGYPSTLGYRGFPKSLCTSVNEVILHGIPDSRPLRRGDIVTLDVTVYLDGMHGDCSSTFAVGEIDEASRRLVEATRECLRLGIEAVRPGRPFHAIGLAIETYARSRGFGVVRDFRGHGIGETFHADPQILHFHDPRDSSPIEEGMIFTVEPMLTEGSPNHVTWPDGWTIATADGKRAAQCEHTVLVTRDGAEILTSL